VAGIIQPFVPFVPFADLPLAAVAQVMGVDFWGPV
jgi:hypothetical protein